MTPTSIDTFNSNTPYTINMYMGGMLDGPSFEDRERNKKAKALAAQYKKERETFARLRAKRKKKKKK